MNRTNAVEVICHALCPGPGPGMLEATFASPDGLATSLKYASISATRCSRFGAAGAASAPGAAAAASGAATEAFTSSACANAAVKLHKNKNVYRSFFMLGLV